MYCRVCMIVRMTHMMMTRCIMMVVCGFVSRAVNKHCHNLWPSEKTTNNFKTKSACFANFVVPTAPTWISHKNKTQTTTIMQTRQYMFKTPNQTCTYKTIITITETNKQTRSKQQQRTNKQYLKKHPIQKQTTQNNNTTNNTHNHHPPKNTL